MSELIVYSYHYNISNYGEFIKILRPHVIKRYRASSCNHAKTCCWYEYWWRPCLLKKFACKILIVTIWNCKISSPRSSDRSQVAPKKTLTAASYLLSGIACNSFFFQILYLGFWTLLEAQQLPRGSTSPSFVLFHF